MRLTSARPRAAEIPTRRPVNEPGPTETTMRDSAAAGMPASSSTAATMGISRSAWPLPMVSTREKTSPPD